VMPVLAQCPEQQLRSWMIGCGASSVQKIDTATWLEIVSTAHQLGLPTTNCLSGHIETPEQQMCLSEFSLQTNQPRISSWDHGIHFATICRSEAPQTFAPPCGAQSSSTG